LVRRFTGIEITGLDLEAFLVPVDFDPQGAKHVHHYLNVGYIGNVEYGAFFGGQ
jgi:hypothetical protein